MPQKKPDIYRERDFLIWHGIKPDNYTERGIFLISQKQYNSNNFCYITCTG